MILKATGLSLVTLASLAVLAIVWFGSIEIAVAFLRGERLIPSSRTVDLGECVVGQAYEIPLVVHNFSDQEAILQDVQNSCRCVDKDWGAVTIPPGESRSISLSRTYLEEGEVTRQNILLQFRTDHLEMVRVVTNATVVSPGVPTLAGE